MGRPSKPTQRNGAEPAGAEAESPEKALQTARAEAMRAQRDLENARLEIAEQKRRSSQQALVAAEAIKEARSERDKLRVQLDALRGEVQREKKRGRAGYEEEHAVELEELREKLIAAEENERALERRLAEAQGRERALQARVAASEEAKKAPAAAAPPPPAEPERGFFSKLFGR
ncbi:MAG: hypothetical protein E6J78_06230 [Deltaproteobacteria bacterium]|nr:MAG: hypothetical protein E6J78_06230 [Deltaproteobacteria bacterium]